MWFLRGQSWRRDTKCDCERTVCGFDPHSRIRSGLEFWTITDVSFSIKKAIMTHLQSFSGSPWDGSFERSVQCQIQSKALNIWKLTAKAYFLQSIPSTQRLDRNTRRSRVYRLWQRPYWRSLASWCSSRLTNWTVGNLLSGLFLSILGR